MGHGVRIVRRTFALHICEIASSHQENSPRAAGHLFAGNDQVFNWYFWKGPTLGYSKQDFLKLGSGGLRFY